jgi:hypothetical protein
MLAVASALTLDFGKKVVPRYEKICSWVIAGNQINRNLYQMCSLAIFIEVFTAAQKVVITTARTHLLPILINVLILIV